MGEPLCLEIREYRDVASGVAAPGYPRVVVDDQEIQARGFGQPDEVAVQFTGTGLKFPRDERSARR